MQHWIDAVTALYARYKGEPPASLDVLPQSGSERRYFRLWGAQHAASQNPEAQQKASQQSSSPFSVIGTYGNNIKENEAFFYFSEHFKKKGLAVPEILAISDDRQFYLQEDFGDASLLHLLESKGFTEEIYQLFAKTTTALAELQVKGDEGLNYNKCLTNKEFGKQAILADLLYFKYYFLDALRRPYDKQKLIDDFEALSNYLTRTEYQYFLFRDFQSRNIMVSQDNKVHFIDYQGGMKGAPQYDLASLLWQARANLSADWKQRLLEDYMDAFESTINSKIDRKLFKSQYNGYVLIRLLQVLGAYGFRGLFERKAQFLTSIPLALRNLKEFLSQHSVGIAVPEFRKVLEICTSHEVIDQFTPTQATESTPLEVKVYSFSYRNGHPPDTSGNGGGFMFDCRGILNPGRVESMKTLTGRDKPVRDFLEQQTNMPSFLNSVFDIVDMTVEDYIKRGFQSLTVGFGCTGGQHRSVYAADEMARHLRNKFKVKVNLHHVVQDEKNWINTPAAE
jgi:aminoglycoside/choline kinase family phosphotransferase